MIYNTIHHDIRNKVGLSMIDYCLLESIYKLSNSSKSTYQSWCNASKSSFSYLASKRTIGTRFEHLEAKGWIEFYDHKRYLKRTTKKYYNEVWLYIEGVKKLPKEETSPVKELHPTGEEVAPLLVKKLHPTGEEVAPNNTIDNKKDNNIDRESKKALAQEIELLKIMNEKYKEEIKALNSESKPEVVPPPTDYSPRKPKRKKELPKGFESELDKSLKSYTFPKEIQADLLEKTLEYFFYLEQKKGSNWGIVRTVNAQVKTIKDLTAKFTDEEIIKSLDECMDNGNVSFNPQWTLNRNNGKSQKPKGHKKFSYELPDFETPEQRQFFFLAKYTKYTESGLLNNRLVNTEYRQRALLEKDAEGLCHKLEQEIPELLKLN